MTEGERRLVVYLDDHAALLTVARALVDRMAGSGAHAAHGALLAGAAAELADDRARVASLMARHGRRPSRLKGAAALLAERAGRLKPNGRLVRRSPLSPLVELQGLALLLDAARAMWRTLERAGGAAADREDFAARAARAAARRDEAEEARLSLAPSALGAP